MGTTTMDDQLVSPWFTGGDPPDRSLEQRLTALAKGNDRRIRRAQLKRDIKAGRRSASAILADPPEWAEAMKVVELLRAIPKWGDVKVKHACRHIEFSSTKTIAGVTARQRSELLRWLHGR